MSENTATSVDEVVRFDPKAPAGVTQDRASLRKGQAGMIKSLRKTIQRPDTAKPGGPDAHFLLHQAYKSAGAHKVAARLAGKHSGSKAPEPPQARPHSQASSSAHTASDNAHEHGYAAQQHPSAAAARQARDSHKQAHDLHVHAAKAMHAAGQYAGSQDHVRKAKDHAEKSMQFHQMMGHHAGLEAMRAASAKKRAASESVEPWREVFFNENAEDPIAHAHTLSHMANKASQEHPDNHEAASHLHYQAQKATWHALQHISKSENPTAHPHYAQMAHLNRHHRKMGFMHTEKHQAQKTMVASRDSVGGEAMVEQRRLMGMNPYPTLSEATSLKELDEFEREMRSWRYTQRELMGLENNYPGLNLTEVYDPPSEEDNLGGGLVTKDKSQGLVDVNYQVLADKAARASAIAHHGSEGNHRAAAQAHAAAAKVATTEKSRAEHEGLARHHELHAGRPPETKVAQVQTKTVGESTEDVMKEAADTRDVPASVKHQARSIEKDGGSFKKRKGGAKTRAGIAYAIAWKNHCRKNPGSRHCNKSEDVQKEDAHSDSVLAKLAKKHGPEGSAHKSSASSTLDKLGKKYGKEHKEDRMAAGQSFMDRLKKKGKKTEDAVSTAALDRLSKRHGAEEPKHKSAASGVLAKLGKKYGKESKEEGVVSKLAGLLKGKKGGKPTVGRRGPHSLSKNRFEQTETGTTDLVEDDLVEDKELFDAIDAAWQSKFGGQAKNASGA